MLLPLPSPHERIAALVLKNGNEDGAQLNHALADEGALPVGRAPMRALPAAGVIARELPKESVSALLEVPEGPAE